jgi:hypothetical protein
MLSEIDRDLWIADGPTVSFFGFPYPTRMALVRLRDGGLWLWSPIARTPELAGEVEALGPVRHLVSPNQIHHLFLGEWAQAHPDATLWASPGLARRRRDLAFGGELGDAPDPAWAEDIDQVIFRGSFAMEEVVFFHRASRSAIIADLVQKIDPATQHGWRGWLMRMDGLVGPDGSTPREWRASFWKRRAARAALGTALAWDPQRLILAHGGCVHADGRAVLARSLAWLGA